MMNHHFSLKRGVRSILMTGLLYPTSWVTGLGYMQQMWLFSKSITMTCESPVEDRGATYLHTSSGVILPYLGTKWFLKQVLSSWQAFQIMPSILGWVLPKCQLVSSQTLNSVSEYSISRQVLFTLEPMPRQTEQVLSVSLRMLSASSIVFANWSTSLRAQVQGLPKRVIVSAGPPLSLSETPIFAEEQPVRLPRKPAQAMLAKGTDPTSVGWQTAIMGNLEIGACSSQSRALNWISFPLSVAGPHHPPMLQEALRISGMRLMRLQVLAGMPEPLAIPLNSSSHLLGVYFLVMMQLRSSNLLARATPVNPMSFLIHLGSELIWVTLLAMNPAAHPKKSLTMTLSSSFMRVPQASPIWKAVPFKESTQNFLPSQSEQGMKYHRQISSHWQLKQQARVIARSVENDSRGRRSLRCRRRAPAPGWPSGGGQAKGLAYN